MSVAAIAAALPAAAQLVPVAEKVGKGAVEVAADFASLLKGVGADAIDRLRGAENLSLDALSGKASTREVAEAVMSAEQTLQIAVGIRDKVVSAYLELSRMAI